MLVEKIELEEYERISKDVTKVTPSYLVFTIGIEEWAMTSQRGQVAGAVLAL